MQLQDAESVVPRTELRVAAGGTAPVRDGHFGDGEPLRQRLQGVLDLGLEAAAPQPDEGHEALRQDTVPRQDVGEAGAVQEVHQRGDDRVAAMMKRAERPRFVRRQAGPDQHVEVGACELLQHGRRGVGRVGVVAVDQDVGVRVDDLRHVAEHVALPLAGGMHRPSRLPARRVRPFRRSSCCRRRRCAPAAARERNHARRRRGCVRSASCHSRE